MLVSSLMQNAWDLSTRPADLTIVAEQQQPQGEQHDTNDHTNDHRVAPENDEDDQINLTTYNFELKQRGEYNHHHHQQQNHRLMHQQAKDRQVATRNSYRTSQLSRGLASPTTSSASSSSFDHHQQADLLLSANGKPSANNQRGDRRARKKDQNRRAALNYRRKKMEERNRVREEEMRLVYARVCLIGHAEELETNIKYLLETQCQKLTDKRGRLKGLLCPLCSETCDNVILMRRHLATWHQQWLMNNLPQQQQFDNNSSSNSINDGKNLDDINVNPNSQQKQQIQQHLTLPERHQFLHLHQQH